LKLAKIAWAGWDVSWAYHGISHVVDALGVERDRVLGKLSSSTFDPTKLYTCHTQGRARMLLSLNDKTGLEHYGFDAPVEYYLVAGESLIDCLHRCRLYSVADLEQGLHLPEDAIFIDKINKRLVVTLAPVFGFYDPRIVKMIKSNWPGWKVDMNYEGLRQHPAVADLDFRIPERDLDEMLNQLRTAVCFTPSKPAPAQARTGAGTALSDAPAASAPGLPSARHRFVPLDKEKRERLFETFSQKLKAQIRKEN
jgi:hypothetical protein